MAVGRSRLPVRSVRRARRGETSGPPPRPAEVKRRRSRWDSGPGIALTVVLAFAAVLLFLVTLPVTGPLLAWSEARAGRRKRAAVERWPCGWCTAPLGTAALERADALVAAYAAAAFSDDMLYVRFVRDLYACCLRCDAGHRYTERDGTFALLHPREFETMYADALRDAVPPASAAMAWAWLRPAEPMHVAALVLDDAEAGTVQVPACAEAAALAEALLRAWDGDADWRAEAEPLVLLFGRREGIPYIRREGPTFVAANRVAVLRVPREQAA